MNQQELESGWRGETRDCAVAYDAYADGIYTYALAYLRDHDAAADTLYSVFVLAARHAPRLRDVSLLRPWLYALCRYECLSRRQDTDPQPVTSRLRVDAPSDEALISLERSLRQAELRSIDWDAAEGLPAHQRETLELTIRHGLDARETGLVLQLADGVAGSEVELAIRELTRSLAVLALAGTLRWHCVAFERLSRGWNGPLTEHVRTPLAAHVDACHRCQHELHTELGVPELPTILPYVAPPRGLRALLLADLALSPDRGFAELVRRTPDFDGRGFPRTVLLRPEPTEPEAVAVEPPRTLGSRRGARRAANRTAGERRSPRVAAATADRQGDPPRTASGPVPVPRAPSDVWLSRPLPRRATPVVPRASGARRLVGGLAAVGAVGAVGSLAYLGFGVVAPRHPETTLITTSPDDDPSTAGGLIHASAAPGGGVAPHASRQVGSTPADDEVGASVSSPGYEARHAVPTTTPTAGPGVLHVEIEQRSGDPNAVTAQLWNSGASPVAWSAAPDVPYVTLSESSGVLGPAGRTAVTMTVDPSTAPSTWVAHVRFMPGDSVVTLRSALGNPPPTPPPPTSPPPSTPPPTSPPPTSPPPTSPASPTGDKSASPPSRPVPAPPSDSGSPPARGGASSATRPNQRPS